MSDKEWDKLFDLIEKAINLPELSSNEKAKLIYDEAKKRGQDGSLEEFLACQE